MAVVEPVYVYDLEGEPEPMGTLESLFLLMVVVVVVAGSRLREVAERWYRAVRGEREAPRAADHYNGRPEPFEETTGTAERLVMCSVVLVTMAVLSVLWLVSWLFTPLSNLLFGRRSGPR